MPRGERPLDPGDTPLLRFAADLRKLREKAGSPPYRELARRAHFSAAALSEAASGRRLPSLDVTSAYVRACAGDVELWEERWHELAAQLAAENPPPENESPAPYVGLGAFQREDADRFFGRERLVEELLAALSRTRFVAVFGASGSGKSSLLRAGLLPRLESAVLCTPGTRPVEQCSARLAELDGASDPVLVVDQFEEIFTLCRDIRTRAEFVRMLVDAPCRVVIGVRADFFAHCTGFPELVEVLRDGQITVGPMTATELQRATVQPAVQVGCALESSLQATIAAEAASQPGVLPLLSHALLETWRRRRGNTLTLSGFQAAGGLAGSLAQTAESVHGSLTERQQLLARSLFQRLTAVGEDAGDVKRVVAHDELDEDPDLAVVLDRFTSARLLTTGRDGVELAHEALLRRWPRLRDWLAEDKEGLLLHRGLTEATQTWESLGKDPGSLFRGVRLTLTRDWALAHLEALSTRERAFLHTSTTAELRRTRRARRLVVALVILLLLAVGEAGYAMHAENIAAQQRDVALSRIVAGKADALRRTNPTLAAQLSLAAYRLAPTDEARTSLFGTFPLPYSRLRGHTGHVNSVAFSADGRMVVTASHDGTAKLWDVAQGKEIAALTGHRGTVNAAAFSPDGHTVATAGWDYTARLWSSDDRAGRALLSGHTLEVNAVAFNHDGTLVATASTDRTAKVWDVRTGEEVATLSGHTNGLVAVAFGAEDVVATAGWDRHTGVWRLSDPTHPVFLSGHTAPVVWLAFSPDGHTLATAGQDGQVLLWDTTDPRNPTRLGAITGHDGIVRSVAFRGDGKVLATAGVDQTARLWDISVPDSAKQIAVVTGHGSAVVSVAFSPDGHTLATGSDDDTALLWKVPELPLTDPSQAARWVCSAARPLITQSEWDQYFTGLPYDPSCRSN
ncbi:WD40 repeat domain-containing protein [Lentzea sp. NPDC005914]|uniref:WD40 repeat domain-containing protein n=1 Tax=Lentzea sp. NPDC005914 TaxID=3154572 RepID=UPI0033F42442